MRRPKGPLVWFHAVTVGERLGWGGRGRAWGSPARPCGSRLAGWRRPLQAGRQAGRQAVRQAGRQAGRQQQRAPGSQRRLSSPATAPRNPSRLPPPARPPAECAVALPVVFRCLLEYNENVHVLLTTGSPEAHALLAGSLPRRVVLRRAPFENAASVRAFLARWRPQVRGRGGGLLWRRGGGVRGAGSRRQARMGAAAARCRARRCTERPPFPASFPAPARLPEGWRLRRGSLVAAARRARRRVGPAPRAAQRAPRQRLVRAPLPLAPRARAAGARARALHAHRAAERRGAAARSGGGRARAALPVLEPARLIQARRPETCPFRAPPLLPPSPGPQDVGRFRILGATLQQMPGWCSDLKYAGGGAWWGRAPG
jgi:hypothetical protein